MDTPELKPYPVPDGIKVPNLMPYQLFPWNNDPNIAAEVLRLKAAHGLTMAIETGTCLGSTTLWLREHFDSVDTIEISREYAAIAEARIGDDDGCSVTIGNSADYVGNYVNAYGSRTFVFLDAHWGDHCPLLDELENIATWNEQEGQVTPCILIHDFKVPGMCFGHDSMPDGRPFNLELIAGHLDKIYGAGKWKYNYPTQVAGAKRGWISIEPC